MTPEPNQQTVQATPGPWRYELEDGYCGELIAANGKVICSFVDEPSAADATVMSAAPDLVLLAEFVVNTIHTVENRCMAADGPVTPTCDEITDDELRKLYVAARAALAKAGAV
jgi:hypothetical protein